LEKGEIIMNKKVIQHFKDNDKVLFLAIKRVGGIKKIEKCGPEIYFVKLCREIIGQQLIGKVAKIIFGRFEDLFSNKKVTPRKVLNIPHEVLRGVGMSHAKARYVRNLAEMVVSKELIFNDFEKLDNEQVVGELTKVKGIGPWTAEMFLMFTLAREDVFSHGDLGLRKAVQKMYGFKDKPSKEQIENIAIKWAPYRTYACLILWQSLDV